MYLWFYDKRATESRDTLKSYQIGNYSAGLDIKDLGNLAELISSG